MKHNQMRQVVFPILAAFIWGTAFVAQDMCADSIGAFAFNASRYFIAVLALLVVIVISDKLKRTSPPSPLLRKRPPTSSCGSVACAAVRRWPWPPTSSRRAWSPVPTAARPAS